MVPPSIETDNYPPSGSGCTPSGTVTASMADYLAFPLYNPIVGPDGSVYAETYVRSSSYTFSCSGSNLTTTSSSITDALSLLQVAPTGSVTITPIKTYTVTENYYVADQNNHIAPGEIIPDGSSGVLASWMNLVDSPHTTHVTDVTSSGANDYTLSSLAGGIVSQMVLGDQGSDIAYANDSNHVLAFHISNGSTAWMYTAPFTGLNLIAAVSGGGGVATSTRPGVDTVLRFDATGNLTTDNWSAYSGLDYYIGNLWTGTSSGGAAQGYYAGPVQLSGSPWFAPAMMGSRKAIQYLHVTNPLNQGSHQDSIRSVLQKMLNALPVNTSCNNWLQGAGGNAGVSGSALIQAHIQNNTFGHGFFNIPAEAVSGNKNSDGSSTGIPISYAFTVNDSGAFFNVTDGAGHQFQYGPHEYPGNTLRTQAAILLHEYGHQLTIGAGTPAAFLKDYGIAKAELFNNNLVDKNCRQLIEGLQ